MLYNVIGEGEILMKKVGIRHLYNLVPFLGLFIAYSNFSNHHSEFIRGLSLALVFVGVYTLTLDTYKSFVDEKVENE